MNPNTVTVVERKRIKTNADKYHSFVNNNKEGAKQILATKQLSEANVKSYEVLKQINESNLHEHDISLCKKASEKLNAFIS